VVAVVVEEGQEREKEKELVDLATFHLVDRIHLHVPHQAEVKQCFNSK
jgi:hypothetical protein